MAEPNRYTLADLPGLVGQPLGQSGWRRVVQRDIDLFAEATGDHAALHVDPEAARRGPYGRTIAHGFLTLSLVAPLSAEAFAITGAGALVNYGVNRARFPAPLPEGTAVQLSTGLAELAQRPHGQLLTLDFEIRTEGGAVVAVGQTVLLAMAEAGTDG